MKHFYATLLFTFLGFQTFQSFAQDTRVTFYTTMGDFEIEMYDSLAPITSGNFLDLVGQKFYDGVIFHRVIDNFMIQGGDPTGTGTGGPGYTIQDEFHVDLSNVQQTISMANTGQPNSGGSQFFINLVDNTYLDFDKNPLSAKHPPFGIVTNNFSVVQAIGKVATNGQDRPLTDVVMDSIRITYKKPNSVRDLTSITGDLKVSPNPLQSTSTLTLSSQTQEEVRLLVYNTLGSLVHQDNLSLQPGENSIPVGQLMNKIQTNGIYHLVLENEQSFVQVKVLKVE